MIRHRKPILMGLMMGLAMPWMMHVDGGGAAFVLAHVAVVGGLVASALLMPRLRTWLHRPTLKHMAAMAPAAAFGWAATCLFCLTIGGTHWI